MIKFLCEAQEGAGNDAVTRVVMIVLLVVVMAGMLIMPYFNAKKRNSEYEAMVNSLKAGDLVKTAGGIIGRIVKIMDKGEIKTVILETGSKTEKSYMEFDLNMIYCILKTAKAENEEADDLDDEDEEENEEAEAQVEETTEAPVEEAQETETAAEEKTEEKPAEKKDTDKYKKAPIKKKNKK